MPWRSFTASWFLEAIRNQVLHAFILFALHIVSIGTRSLHRMELTWEINSH
jgi:hypothetical protein